MLNYLQLIPTLFLISNIFYTFTQYHLTPISIGIITYFPFNLLYYSSHWRLLPITNKLLNLLDIVFQYVMIFIWSTSLNYVIFRYTCYLLIIYYINFYVYIYRQETLHLVDFIDLHYLTLLSIIAVFNFDVILHNGILGIIPVYIPLLFGMISYLSNLKYKYIILNLCQVLFCRQMFLYLK